MDLGNLTGRNERDSMFKRLRNSRGEVSIVTAPIVVILVLPIIRLV